MDYLEEYKTPNIDPDKTREKLATDYADYFRLGLGLDPDSEDSREYTNNFIPRMNEYLYAEQRSPENTGEKMISRILDAYNTANPHKEPVETLSKAVDSYGLNYRILRSLSSIDLINLLQATAYAGMSRHTRPGVKLSKEARRILAHEATNTWAQSETQTEIREQDEARNFDRLVRSGLADYAEAKLATLDALQLPDEAPVVSIDTVLPIMAKPRYLFSDQSSIEDDLRMAAGIELLEHYDEPEEPIRNIPEEKLHQRLTDLSLLESDLRDTFGQDITLIYKEIAPGTDKTTRDLYESSGRVAAEKSESESSEGPSDFSEYTFIEITKSTGETFVIADSAISPNACYVVRGDILAKVGTLLDRDVSWMDVLKYPKETARQLGAQRLYHTENTDTLERAVNCINRPINEILKDIGAKWIIGSSSIFDETMAPTTKNRLPQAMRDSVQKRAGEVEAILLSWLGLESVPLREGSAVHLGRIATKQSAEDRAESMSEKVARLEAELVKSEEEKRLLRIEVDELKTTIRSIAALVE